MYNASRLAAFFSDSKDRTARRWRFMAGYSSPRLSFHIGCSGLNYLSADHRDKVVISIFISVSVEVCQGEGSASSIGVFPNGKKWNPGVARADL